MDHEKQWRTMLGYKPEAWRDDEEAKGRGLSPDERMFSRRGFITSSSSPSRPDVRDQTRVLDLLGRINYKIIQGSKVYIEVGGVVYKTLYGGYWRSVFTGVEHYLLRCEQVSGSAWADDDDHATVDLAVAYSSDGWTASGHSLSFMLSRDWPGGRSRSRGQALSIRVAQIAQTAQKILSTARARRRHDS